MKSKKESSHTIKKYSLSKIYICLYFLVIFLTGISASDVLVWQGQYYTGTTFNTGTYEFNFTVYDALTGGDICYSNTTNLTTGNWGEWETEQSGVSSACNNISKDYYLNININGIDQTPRRRLTIFNYLRKDVNEVTAGDLVLHGVLQGLSPLKLQDEINFIKAEGTITSSLYNAPRGASSALPSVFADSLIHDIIEETNDYGMQECWWDENTTTMQMCISGAYLARRATTISRSLQVVGNTTNKLVNENFTLCEGNKYVDCETDLTGADLLVEDDIESIGSIFSQENITADDTGFFNFLGSLINRITKLWVQDIDASGEVEINQSIFVEGGSGDVDDNGDIDMTDISKVADHLSDSVILTQEEYMRADVDGDGRVTYDDLAMVLELYGQSVPVPVETHRSAERSIHNVAGAFDDETFIINDILRLNPRSSAPSSPVLGEIYADSDTNELCFYDGSSWTGLKAGGVCA